MMITLPKECQETSKEACFLGLPPELRNRIYDFVFPSQVVHIARHPETCQDFPGDCPQAKWAHAVCAVSQKWDEDYEWSKTSEPQEREPRRTVNTKNFLPNYRKRHARCEDALYVATSSRRNPARRSSRIAEATKDKLVRHSKQAFDIALFYTCKQIYTEAKLIPYTNIIFNFTDAFDARNFLTYGLTDQQRECVTAIYLAMFWKAEEGALVLASLQNLEYLRLGLFVLDWPSHKGFGDQYNGRKVKKVEVIAGEDVGNGPSFTRARRRMIAWNIEKLLRESTPATGK